MKRALLILFVTAPCWAEAPAAPTAPPAAAAPDGGAQVAVQVEPNGDTTLDVKKGAVKVRANGRESRVGAGETVRATRGKPLTRVLAAPAPVAPGADAALGTLDAAFSWQKVRGASRYVLEVSPAPELSGAHTQTVEGTRATVHLDAGTWYWSVTALDADGSVGKRSPPRRLTIDTTPPKLKTGKPEWR